MAKMSKQKGVEKTNSRRLFKEKIIERNILDIWGKRKQTQITPAVHIARNDFWKKRTNNIKQQTTKKKISQKSNENFNQLKKNMPKN